MHDVLIVGAGPVGLALAQVLRHSGLSVVVVDRRSRNAAASDPRMLALSHGTRLTLERLDIWPGLSATAIERIEVSQRAAFGRCRILATDYGVPALGYVARAGDLAGALDAALRDSGVTLRPDCAITGLSDQGDHILAHTDQGEAFRARLVACAEGSIGADETIVEHDYGQHAVICLARPAQPHGNTAHERFTAHGPVALLPAGRDYAVVHTVPPDEARTLAQLPPADYLERLHAITGPRLRLTEVGERLSYPLGLRYRPNPTQARCVWLGNAAQTLHPVAGQGFNLALRDVWALADVLTRAPEDPGGVATLQQYSQTRRFDRRATIGFTDLLVRSFSNDFTPLRHARGAALFALEVLPPLRHFIAKRMMFGARAWP